MKLLLLLLVVGCAQVTSLNMKKHQFGITPSKIIWFQIAGLEEEQLAMLRFGQAAEKRTSFEESICAGKSWNYNFYQLRNNAQSTFLSQMTGKKNIKGTCEDTQLRPIWSFLATNGYSGGVLENGATKEQTILALESCQTKEEPYLAGLYLWLRQEPVKGKPTFHYSEQQAFTPDQVYYDRSCGAKSCFSNINEDFKSIYQSLRKASSKHLLVLRDFSYLSALERKDFKEARRILVDLEKTYSEALIMANSSSDTLVLLTTAQSQFVEMPEQGKSWFEFDKQSGGPLPRRPKLTNLILASGARAENFCGIYEDSQVFERILSGPKQQGLELKIINPFK